MAELLGGLPVAGQIGLLGTLFLLPWAALIWAVRRIITGDLVTRQQLIDARQQTVDAQADRDHWRTAHDTQQQIALRHGMTLERLLSLAETGNHVMTQIQAGLQHRGPEEQR